MFYRPNDGHGLPHNPFPAIVSPRPIGWISTRSADGIDNIAPYSFFNAVAYTPAQVMFSSNGKKADQDGKDTLANIRETGVFCVNIVEFAMRDAMNKTSATMESHIDEFSHADIERAECDTIACSYVASAPATLECKLTQIIKLEGDQSHAVFGEVTGIRLRDDCVVNGIFDVTTYKPLARLGYQDYAVIDTVFSLVRPDAK